MFDLKLFYLDHTRKFSLHCKGGKKFLLQKYNSGYCEQSQITFRSAYDTAECGKSLLGKDEK